MKERAGKHIHSGTRLHLGCLKQFCFCQNKGQTLNMTRAHFIKVSERQISMSMATQLDLGVWKGNLIFKGVLALTS